MADLVGAIVAILAADPVVAGMAATRVFGGELPPEETEHMARTALVVEATGGPSLTAGSYAEHDTQRIDVTAYGATRREADQLMKAAAPVLRRLHRTVSAGVLIHWARSGGGYLSGRDPDFAWPRAWQSFQVFHSLQEV